MKRKAEAQTTDRVEGIGRRRLVASAVPAAALLLAGGITRAAPASARPVDRRPANDAVLRLVPPTGPHAIGTTTLYLVDRCRPDPWEPIPVREVMVTVFYPARGVRGFP
ncbi:alpha/beta hydrolase, partial [Embleya sp. NPDC059259]